MHHHDRLHHRVNNRVAGNHRSLFYLCCREEREVNIWIYIAAWAAGILTGAVAAFPSGDYDAKIRGQGAVAVYEQRAKCEKALDQWVCSVPKN